MGNPVEIEILHKPLVLVVDDNQEKLLSLESILENLDLELATASSGADALEILHPLQDFAVILLDVLMPDMDGFETARRIRRMPNCRHIPIIFVSSLEPSEAHKTKGYDLGAVDYIFTPIIPEVLKAKVQVFLDLHRKTKEIQQQAGKLKHINEVLEARVRERTREAQEKEERYRLLVETASDAIITINSRSEILFCNNAVEKIFGYAPQDLIGKSLVVLMPDNLRHLHRSGMERYSETGKRHISWQAVEVSGLHKEGHEIPMEISFGESMLEGEKTFTGIIRDISERKRAVRALEEKDLFLESIYKGAAEAIFVMDVSPEGIFTMLGFNPTYEKLLRSFGLDPSTILGHTTADFRPLFSDDIMNAVEAKYAQCVQTRLPMEYEETLPWEGKITHWLTRLAPLPNAQGVIYRIIGTSSNISQMKDSAQRIRETEEQLRQAQKMEAVGRLAGGIAHDFNNLLTAINGFSELVLEGMEEDSRNAGFLKEIRKAGMRATSLTQQLLAFSRKQVLAPREINLNSIVSDLSKMLTRLIGEDITLEAALDPNLGLVLADPGQMEQVIINLVLNARDAMPTGGRLTIETANVKLDEGSIGSYSPLPSGFFVLLAVTDTGKGMDAQTRSRVFEPFFTTKSVGEGTGLGLSMVYGIVKQSGGHVQVYSEPGQGASFKLYLPSAPTNGEAQASPESSRAPENLQGHETILVVEDESAVVKLVSEILVRYGYTVLSASNGQEAIRLTETLSDPIHLLLTDVVMSQVGGRELADHLRGHRPDMKLIYMSGYTDDTVIRHGILEAKSQFLQKPFTPLDLIRKVRQVLDGETTP